MLIDLHCHTWPLSDDSLLKPDDLIEEAKSLGLHGLCLTEHDYGWNVDDIRALERRHNFVILPGIEVNTDAEKARARTVLGAVPGVASITHGARPGEPWHLEVAPGADPAAVRSGVFAAVATEQLPLTSIRAVVPSLEDIYRRAVARPGGSRVARGHAAVGEVPA